MRRADAVDRDDTVTLLPFHGRSVALFVGGPVTASASVFAFEPDTGEMAQGSGVARLILRGRH